ncbi:permease-like cell division protein FtsX [Curtanaerobium respiraculi]|uniref:permease-like cell division protein FtsX n=1 Tax=Curtanaerobium respiraculi TaxID=2949669 RepID=UPI0024B3A151|nr:permease-like cell division protein FtsX [Curtanaerobium respiraculi]
MSSFGYFFKESLKGFSRNLSTALGSIVTIFLSLMIVGVFLVGGYIVDNIVNSVESKVSITVYVADEASDSDLQSLQGYIKGLDDVAQVSFTSKEAALEKFKNSMTSNPEIIEQLDGQNPLPASIDVELTDAQQVADVAAQIAGNSTFQKICDNPGNPEDSLKYGQKTVEKLFTVTNYIRYIGAALVILLVFIAFVFINNTIRLSILARRKEIAIMRLVGASNNFIRGPFLMEGSLHAVIGAVLAIAILELLRNFGLSRLQDALPWLPIDVSASSFAFIYVLLIVFGLIIGVLGSALAMRRYLKV